MIYSKQNSKMADINPILSVIALKVNESSISYKNQDWKNGYNIYVLSVRDILKRYKYIKSKIKEKIYTKETVTKRELEYLKINGVK